MNQNNRKPKRDAKKDARRDDYKGRAPKRKPEPETNNRPEQQDDFVIGKHAVYETLKSTKECVNSGPDNNNVFRPIIYLTIIVCFK